MICEQKKYPDREQTYEISLHFNENALLNNKLREINNNLIQHDIYNEIYRSWGRQNIPKCVFALSNQKRHWLLCG